VSVQLKTCSHGIFPFFHALNGGRPGSGGAALSMCLPQSVPSPFPVKNPGFHFCSLLSQFLFFPIISPSVFGRCRPPGPRA
jgi:hypothetical protein